VCEGPVRPGELTRADYAEAIRSGLVAQGWPLSCFSPEQEAHDLAALVADWPPGTVVERRLDDLIVRERPERGPAGRVADPDADGGDGPPSPSP
jgi:hypothetical protein